MLTVSDLSAGNFDHPRIPTVRLGGRWLAELGFRAGQRVHVKANPGRLVLTLANEEQSDGTNSARGD
jgi:hypothetical protein